MKWPDTVAGMHGYAPPLSHRPPNPFSHKHPDDRAHVAHTLHTIRTSGGAFSSRHRIIDTRGITRSVVVVGDRLLDEHGNTIGSSGFYSDITDTAVSDLTAFRGAIGQAKGMLVYRIPAGRAFDVLVWHSNKRTSNSATSPNNSSPE
ncbi:hypothetical protein [Rhodococcus sp. UFZ-B548]|uniref:hypothetical protein n=1 Tax=Rhodococcus sp. UFZ-B548 TaxID=2742212 RepID=UPI0015F3DCF3|nr:hypothetical protein [Rhodococcus sp. UFZ-B548]